MSAGLFLKRFLKRPRQVASLVPSSRALTRRLCRKIDFQGAKVIVEFGPGEGCHTRELLARMRADAVLLLFEIDPELLAHLREQFRNDPRVHFFGNAFRVQEALASLGLACCDYVISGIPFSYLEPAAKRSLLARIHSSLSPKPHAAFIVYQVSTELKRHATMFPRADTEYCLRNIPPLFLTCFRK